MAARALMMGSDRRMCLKSAVCEDSNQANHPPAKQAWVQVGPPRVASSIWPHCTQIIRLSYKPWIVSLGWMKSPLHSSTPQSSLSSRCRGGTRKGCVQRSIRR